MDTTHHKFLREFVRHLLLHPDSARWSIQGLGMLRAYLGADRAVRVHLWHSKFRAPNVSAIHDHPWDFDSYVVAGEIRNTLYVPTIPNVESEYKMVHIICGPGQAHCNTERPVQQAFLRRDCTQVVPAGFSYQQGADEIHSSDSRDGTVTVCHRTLRRPDDAKVYWKTGPWVSAEPRDATREEVQEFVDAARQQLENADMLAAARDLPAGSHLAARA